MRHISQDYLDENNSTKVDTKIAAAVADSDRIYILAAGTSYHAVLVGKHLFEKYADILVEVGLAYEFGYHFPKLSKKPFFIFLPQSGETADSSVLLKQDNERHLPSLKMTNVKGSTLSR